MSGIDEPNKKGKIPMRSDDDITREIMEASLGGLGLAAATGLGKGAVAAGKLGANAIGATRAGGRLKGAAMATNVLTKLKRDWGSYVGAQNGVSFKSFVPSENDLIGFVQDYYGYDASPVLAKVMRDLGLKTSGQEQDDQPAEQPAQKPQAAPQAAPAAGAAPKAQPAAPAASQPAQQPQAQAQPQAQPQAAPAAAPAAAQPAAPTDNVVKREKPFYRHNSSFIDFDDPDLADPNTNPWSSKRARDEAKAGNENPAMAQKRVKPPKKQRRNESIEPTSLSFSEIIAEADTASVNTQAVRSKQASQAMASEFLKAMARQIASKPVEYKAFMSGEKTNLSQAGASAHAYTSGKTPWTNTKPNSTNDREIDRKAINDLLTNHLQIHPERMKEIKSEVQGLNPQQTFEKLRQVVKQDEALKIVAALLKTLETK